MEYEPNTPVAERECPLGFVVAPAFIVALVWLCALLARVGP
jgi:hypothetical protein